MHNKFSRSSFYTALLASLALLGFFAALALLVAPANANFNRTTVIPAQDDTTTKTNADTSARVPANAPGKPSVANLKADYQFQGVLTSTVGTPPSLVALGANTFASETVDGSSRTVAQFPQGSNSVLTGYSFSPTTGVISNTRYSTVLLFRFATTSGYRKIVDFKNAANDVGLYNLSGTLVLYSAAFPSTTPISDNQYVQVVLTRDDATKQTIGYVNCVQQFSVTDTTDIGVIDTFNKLIFFRDDTATSSSESSAGAVARIRIYDNVLTPSEVAGLDRLPGSISSCTSNLFLPLVIR